MSKHLTTTAGAPVADNQNTITAGPRGPVLLQDYQLIEKLAHQNRERIPERVVHAKGWGAYGTLTITDDITQVHQGEGLLQVGKKTDAAHALLDRGRRTAARPMPSATCADSRSSSTPRKATGIWSATTRRCFSCAIR